MDFSPNSTSGGLLLLGRPVAGGDSCCYIRRECVSRIWVTIRAQSVRRDPKAGQGRDGKHFPARNFLPLRHSSPALFEGKRKGYDATDATCSFENDFFAHGSEV